MGVPALRVGALNPASADRRYQGRRWTETAKRIRRRDVVCWVPGCGQPAQVADHIYPVYVGMPDSEFYDPANLRGSCRYHNTWRGHMARAEREMGAASAQRPRRFFRGLRTHEVGSPGTELEFAL